MRTYTFHNELKISRTQVLNVFDGLVIKRLLETDEVTNTDSIAVRLLYAPKQRVLFDLVNKSQHISLPVMSFTTSNIKYDSKRSFNKIDGYSLPSQMSANGGTIPQPVPIDFNMNMTVLVNQNRDLDQILTCIFSNFYPYVVASYTHPNVNQEVRMKIEWDGIVNLTYPNDITANTPYRIMADATFNVSTWIFKNFDTTTGIIHNINSNFTAVSEVSDDYETLQDLEGEDYTDYLTLSGRPQLKAISPYAINIEGDKTFNIIGNMYDLVDGLVVSANNLNTYETSSYNLFNPFISSKHLSSLYTEFSAVSVTNWTIVDNNEIQFTLPTPLSGGYVDVIAWSVAGLGKLTTDSYRPSGTFQFPYTQGIKIVG